MQSSFGNQLDCHLSYVSEGIEEDDDTTAPLGTHPITSSNNLSISGLDTVREDESVRRVEKDSVVDTHRRRTSGETTSSSNPSSLASSRRNSGRRLGDTSLDDRSHRCSISQSVTRSINSSRSSIKSRPPVEFARHSEVDASVREIDVSEANSFIEAELLEPLPREYRDVASYGHGEKVCLRRDSTKERKVEKKKTIAAEQARLVKEDDYQMIDFGGGSTQGLNGCSALVQRRSRMYSLFSLMAAMSVVLVGMILAWEALSTPSSQDHQATSLYYDNAALLHMPRYPFGGNAGGILGGIKEEGVQRRAELYQGYESTYNPNIASNNNLPIQSNPTVKLNHDPNPQNVQLIVTGVRSTSNDPFHGFGPPQFNPAFHTRSSFRNKATLSSSPLTSYTPPSDDNNDVSIALDPKFHGSMMDVSLLPYNPVHEIPIVWDISVAGGTRMKYIYGHCLKLVLCSEIGAELSTSLNAPLKAEFIHSSLSVNVDCSTSEGIDRAISQNLATTNLVDVIFTPNIMDGSRLFAPPIEAYGRAVVLMRQPLERVVALYEYLKYARDDPRSFMVGGMSLEEFAKSDFVETNPLTRILSGSDDTPLRESDLKVAKEILKRKFIVGLYDHMQDSLTRFESFFGWHLDSSSQACQSEEVEREMTAYYNKYSKDVRESSAETQSHPDLTPAALESIISKNVIDMKLSEFVKFLFDYQGRMLFGVEAARRS